MHKQTTEYGCGLYAVANACMLGEDFITPERLDQSKAGNTIGQLTIWLYESGLSVCPHPMFYDQLPNSLTMPDAHFMYDVPGIEEEGKMTMPLIYFVKDEGRRPHIIAANLDQAGNLTVMDSKRDEPFVTDQNSLHEHYSEIYGVFGFVDVKTGAYAYFQ